MVKRIDAADHLDMFDNKRDPPSSSWKIFGEIEADT